VLTPTQYREFSLGYMAQILDGLTREADGRVVPRSEIQERQNIPPHFLSKILRSMVAAGFLISIPGSRGGFRLGADPGAINIRAVYESVEGPLALIECVEGHDGACCFASICTQIDIWRGAQQMLARYLEQISIREIADRQGLVPRLREKTPSLGA
jgi:Rrf2 family protein